MDIGVPDYRREALSWRDLELVIRLGRLELLGRSHAQQQEYRDFNAGLLQSWASAADYLLCSKFGLPETVLTTGLRAAVRPEDFRRVVLLRNDFPYHFEESIEHFVLWKCGPESLTAAEIEEARGRLVGELGFAETLFYVNPPHLKSILEIDHAHIIARRG